MSTYSNKFQKLLDAGEIDKINATKWPTSFKKLRINYMFNAPIDGLKFPDSLEYIHFGLNFNQSLDKVQWPANLKVLKFSEMFNYPIDAIKLPDSIVYIQFGDNFNQPINTIFWPQSLHTLMFGFNFKQSFENMRWPSSIKSIIVYYLYNEILSHFPATIECIETQYINEPLCMLPHTLKRLIYGNDTYKYIKQSLIPLKCKLYDYSITMDINTDNFDNVNNNIIY
jgi:hypothetical protein